MKYLCEVFEKPISGEWGTEAIDNNGVRVIRTTNFTNLGKLDLNKEVAIRKIDDKIIAQKKLLYGDIIIEKSGGSPNQPVGRVVFFDKKETTYVCNNFTAILRTKKDSYPKYVLYSMLHLYNTKAVAKFQNKTTGIINLKLNDYLERNQIPLPPLETQKKIAEVLDIAQELIDKRKQQIELLDKFLQSLFIDMFGDPVTNSKGWTKKRLDEITQSRLGKMLDIKNNNGVNPKPYLANQNVQWFRFDLSSLKYMDFSENEMNEFILIEGDLLICEGGDIGRSAIWKGQYTECYFQKALHRVRCNRKLIIPEYLAYWFWFLSKKTGFKDIVGAATIAHLTGVKLKALEIPLAPIDIQNKFAEIVETTEKQRELMERSLALMEQNLKGLMQRAFRGELFN
ncbi:MAG: restriction endonuclease subunit S [Syntrophomonas sp.]